jgi:microcompartment protein CcmL/EutN
MNDGVAVLEITALGAALVILDAVDKSAPVRVLQAELNDFYGYVLKIQGDAAALRSAVATARQTADQMGARCIVTVIDAPDERAWKAIETPCEYQPLIEQNVVFLPIMAAYPNRACLGGSLPDSYDAPESTETIMSKSQPFAIGLIETQGFTAVIEAIDTACKSANVEVIGKEKLGGGYITVLIKGDVAAVSAAIEAGKAKVPGLGNLIAAHIIAHPSPAVLSLLPSL